ncbi:MAG: ATP-binding protein [Saprospiraceae bacterium]
MHKNLLLYFLCSILSFWAAAQKADFQFFTTADGLSGSLTHGMAQDDQGFIWVLNNYKLHRYDGRKFVLYQPPSDLPGSSKELEGLYFIEDSLLLVRSRTYVFLLNPRTGDWQSIPVPFEEESGKFLLHAGFYKNGDIGMFEISNDYDDLRLWRFANRQFVPTRIQYQSPVRDKPFFMNPNGHLYLAWNNKMEKHDAATQEITNLELDIMPEGFSAQHINDLGDLLVFLTSSPNAHAVYTVPDDLSGYVPHPVNRFLKKPNVILGSILPEKNGRLWLCGNDRQLLHYEPVKDTIYDYTPILKEILPSINDILYPFIDKTGTVWFMTRLGLLKMTFHESAFDQYFAQPHDVCKGFCSFRGLAENTKGEIFAGFYGGLAQLDPVEKREVKLVPFEYPLPLPSNLYADDRGLWLSNGQLMNLRTVSDWIAPPGAKQGTGEEGLFTVTKDGRLWWVYKHELFFQETQDLELRWVKELELPSKDTYATEALYTGQKSGHIFIGHKGQLLRYDPDSKTQTWYGPQDWGLPVTRIMAIEEDNKQNLWLATDIGLVYFDPVYGQAQLFTTEDGLPNNYVCGMLAEGDSCLWLSTNHGLSRFHMASETFINFFEEDGLTHNEFNRKSYFKASDGRMFFGGLRGINAFYPKELMQNYQRRNKAAQVVLSAVEYSDEKRDTAFVLHDFSSQPAIHLYHWQRSFTFEYALTDFRNPQEVTYSYQMEGYESNWSAPSKFNFTRFSSLPSGDYTFRVRAKDSHGLWHPNELAVKVIVHPPWWATWWAYLCYTLLLGGIAFGIFSFLKKRWQLQNELRLEQAEAIRLKELDSFKSRLYTNLTHEFRTPLTVILGMARQLAVGSWQSALPPDEKERMKTGLKLIDRNGNNLLRLINQLLDLSKLEDNSFKLNLQQGDIVPYLRYVTESFQTYANSKNLSLRFFTTLEQLEMDFDPQQIKQVMTNLISNAVKFTPSGGEVKVKVSVIPNSRSGEWKAPERELGITVADTGIGISKADLPHVFDRFYQVDGSHTREGEGTGIGLAHTLELVNLMEGEINVESELGKGTVFQISLPVRQLASSAVRQFDSPAVQLQSFDQLPTNEQDWRTAELKTGELPTLLIIEDNPDVVVYLKSCLAEQYQLDVAYNGKIGIEKALEDIPDLIISDVMMPEKDGYQVCDTLKNDERTSHIPIILLTAKADAASKMVGLRRGADTYLAKPFDKEELLVWLEKLLERQQRLAAYFSKKIVGEEQDRPAEAVVQEAIAIEDEFIQKVRKIVAENFGDESFALPQLCQKIGMSRSQLFRKMKALIDQSPSDFIRNYRLYQAKSLLETTDLNVSEVAWKVGFKDPAHFSRSFQEIFGVLPSNVPPDS